MTRQVHLNDSTRLVLSPTPFAGGGEGELFHILSPAHLAEFIVKIYKPDKQTEERRRKIEYLVANPPTLQAAHGHHAVVWIKNAVYEHHRFVGFMMPMAKGQKLEFLCHAVLPKQLGPEWRKFQFGQPKALDLRLKICFNIAVALYEIHSLGNYVLVDMKPENIMIQSNGLISVIDIDSVEIMKNQRILFPAPVATPEYSPPEFYKGVKPEKVGVTEVWDRFSMAVIFYRLLTGIHPFTGSCKPPFEKCNGLPDMVENGLFPHGNKASYFHRIPPPHTHFKRLKRNVQQLFVKCFEEGHMDPNKRPSAEDWCRALSPQPINVGKRPLPSSILDFTLPFPTASLPYPFPTKVSLPSGQGFLKIAEPIGIEFLVKMFLGNTPRQVLKERIEEQQQQIYDLAARKPQFDKTLQQLADRYADKEKAVLDKEKKKLDQLYTAYTNKLASLDKNASDLLEKEKKDIQRANDEIRTSVDMLEKENQMIQRRLHDIESRYTLKSKELETMLGGLKPEQVELGQSLRASLTSLQNRHQQDAEPLKEAIQHQIEHKTKMLIEQKNGKHEALRKVEMKYDTLFDSLKRKTNELFLSTTTKADEIQAETEKLLKENHQSIAQQYAKVKRDVDQYLADFDQQLKLLNKMQEDYKRWF